MRQKIHSLLAGILFAALLPVTAWGFDYYDYPGGGGYGPYAGPEGGRYSSGSLRLEKGMTEDGYYVRAWLDGLNPEDIQVSVRRNRLVLEVDQSHRYAQENSSARRFSQWHMSTRRQLRLPYDADFAHITTSSKDGVLEILIPRRNP